MLVNASIDLTKIDKRKIQTVDKNGQPFKNGAKYLSIQIWVNDQPDQYGNDASINISQSQAERESGVKKTYIGNGKVFKQQAPPQASAAQAFKPSANLPSGGVDFGDSDSETLPF